MRTLIIDTDYLSLSKMFYKCDQLQLGRGECGWLTEVRRDKPLYLPKVKAKVKKMYYADLVIQDTLYDTGHIY